MARAVAALALALLAACAEPPAGEAEEAGGLPMQGKWRPARTRPAPGADEDRARLVATPYLQGYRPAREAPIIARHEVERTAPGLNLYVSGHAAEAVLMDNAGRPLHRWRYGLRRVWPDLFAGPDGGGMSRLDYWRRAALLPDGSLLAIFEGLGLVKVDRRSRLVWAWRGGAHHDLFVRPDGTIWVLDRRQVVLSRFHREEPVLEDLVTVLDADGRPLRQLSVVEAFARSPFAPALGQLAGKSGDVTHTNTLEWIGDNPVRQRVPAFAPGRLLVSVHAIDTVAVIDPEGVEVMWALSGLWRRQHQPTLLAGGGLLVFDNVGLGDRSRVLELDPATQEVAWQWPQRPDPQTFFSRTLGSVQRLANGNTLVTESENGRAVEVTREGEVVWEFLTPHRAGDEDQLVATLFEVERLEEPLPWLGEASGRGGGSGLQ